MGGTVTKARAAELQAKWKLRADSAPCLHPSQELGHSEDGYLTAIRHCVNCGEILGTLVLPPSPPTSIST